MDTILSLDGASNASGWLAGSDLNNEGVWTWRSGPESGQEFFTWTSGSRPIASGSRFHPWAPLPVCSASTNHPNNCAGCQPDNCSEHFLQRYSTSGAGWNDLPDHGAGVITGYFVEYGGLGTDPNFVVVRIEKHNAFIPGSQF